VYNCITKKSLMMKWSVQNKHRSKCLDISKQKNALPLSPNIHNIGMSISTPFKHFLDSKWRLLTKIICLQRVDLLKKRQDLLTNQSVSGGHIYLLPTKSALSAATANLTIFCRFFPRKWRQFCSLTGAATLKQ
jgi:hypothetical protein